MSRVWLTSVLKRNMVFIGLLSSFLQTCQNPIRPLTPSSLLDSICWSISEPSSSASIYTDSFSSEGVSEHHTPEFFDATGDDKESEASFANLTRPLSERSDHFYGLRSMHLIIYLITIHVKFVVQVVSNMDTTAFSHFLLSPAVRNLKLYSKTIS